MATRFRLIRLLGALTSTAPLGCAVEPPVAEASIFAPLGCGQEITYRAVVELYPEVQREMKAACGSRAWAEGSYLDRANLLRAPYNNLLVRQMTLANEDNLLRFIQLRRQHLAAAAGAGPGACYDVVLGGGNLAFDPMTVLPAPVIEREWVEVPELLRQTALEPAAYQSTDADRKRVETIFNATFNRLDVADQRAVLDIVEQRVGSFTGPDLMLLCGVSASVLDELLSLPRAETTRLYKAFIASPWGWAVASTGAGDPWARRAS